MALRRISANPLLRHCTRPSLYSSKRRTSPIPVSMAGSTTSRRTLTVPAGAWDAHTHVADPERFPPSKKAVYKVHKAPLSALQATAARLGVPNLVFVQTSTYGTDNAWILQCLRDVGTSHGRGVVVVEPGSSDASEANLREWHALGVRGVRLNFTSVKRSVDPEELRGMVRTYADMIRPLGTWGIHFYMPLKLVPVLSENGGKLVDDLGVNVVLDHFGDPASIEAPMAKQEGWEELLGLLRKPNVHVKISAPYRFTKDPEFRGMDHLIRELMAAKDGKGIVFASDWPHTRFEDTDIRPWVDRCLEACDGDADRAVKLFKTNAEELFDVPR